MKKSSIKSTGRRHRDEPSPSVQGIALPSTLSLRLSTVTKDVEWNRAGSGSDVERSMERQLETYVLATLDTMDLPRGDVDITFRFETGQSSEITLKSIAGTKQRRAIMTTLTDALRQMGESEVRSYSPFPIEIVLDTRAGTATSVGREQTKSDVGTTAEELASDVEVGHGQAMSDVEQLAETTMESIVDLVTTERDQEAEVGRQVYGSVRDFLRKLARAVPLPSDYAKAWKTKYPPTKKGPGGESVRQRNMGKTDVPYREEPLRRAFEAIVQHAVTWSELPVEDVLERCRKEVQNALLDDIDIKLQHGIDFWSISNKTSKYLKSASKTSDSDRVKTSKQNTGKSEGQSVELQREKLPARPRSPYGELMEHLEQFLQANPGYAEKVLEDCKEIVDRYRPLGMHRNLGIQDAVRITGFSETRIYQLTEEEGLGEKIGTRWKFSEAELHKASQKERKVGRPPKQARPENGG